MNTCLLFFINLLENLCFSIFIMSFPLINHKKSFFKCFSMFSYWLWPSSDGNALFLKNFEIFLIFFFVLFYFKIFFYKNDLRIYFYSFCSLLKFTNTFFLGIRSFNSFSRLIEIGVPPSSVINSPGKSIAIPFQIFTVGCGSMLVISEICKRLENNYSQSFCNLGDYTSIR